MDRPLAEHLTLATAVHWPGRTGLAVKRGVSGVVALHLPVDRGMLERGVGPVLRRIDEASSSVGRHGRGGRCQMRALPPTARRVKDADRGNSRRGKGSDKETNP